MRGPIFKRRHQLIRPVAFGGCLVNSLVIGLDALGALGIVGHGRLRVYIARDGINEVVVGSERVPDQFPMKTRVTSYRSAHCKTGLSYKCSAMGPELPVDGDLRNDGPSCQ